MLPRFPARGLYVRASAPQVLCLKLQEQKQTLQANVSQLRSGMADLKECVQTFQERERLLASPKLNPLPTTRQSRNTGLGEATTWLDCSMPAATSIPTTNTLIIALLFYFTSSAAHPLVHW